MAAEHIRKWQVGDVEIARIVEVNDHTDPFSMLSKDLTAEDALRHDWLQPHFITPDGRMKISFQCFVLRSGKDNVMIDTCIGNGRHREFDVFTNMRTSFPRRPRDRRLSARVDHQGSVHASALRSRRLEHDAGGRQMGADLPHRPLLFRARGVRALERAGAHRQLSRPSPIWAIRSIRCSMRAWSSSSDRRRRSPTR